MNKSMKFLLALMAMLSAAPLLAQAEGVLDWLQPITSGGKAGSAAVKPADSAELLTLEPKESEMYPLASADGRHLIVTVSQGKDGWISRRAAENGDPLNVVIDDPRAIDSTRWSGEAVTFLSERAGSLGLWTKGSDGQGIVRRVKELQGNLSQPIYLKDGSVIAVRFEAEGKSSKASSVRTDGFNNWDIAGYQSQIVLIDPNGSLKVLSQGTNPAISPDGERVVFTMPVGRSFHLFMMKVDGSELSQLTDERSVDVQPSWSPDGKWVVFTSNRAMADMRKASNSNWDIWAIDREGKNLTQLTMDEARDGAPSMGANGRVYFHSDRKVDSEVKKARQVKESVGSFHIWSIVLPQ